jgi:hypothetical protein
MSNNNEQETIAPQDLAAASGGAGNPLDDFGLGPITDGGGGTAGRIQQIEGYWQTGSPEERKQAAADLHSYFQQHPQDRLKDAWQGPGHPVFPK